MPELDDLSSGREALPDSNGSDADFALLPGVPRDNNGRFIKQEPQEPAAPQPQGQQPEPQNTDEGEEPEAGQQRQQGSVPPQALAAERQKRKQAQDQFAQAQAQHAREIAELRGTVQALMQGAQPGRQQPEQPKGPPPFWENPDEATDYRVRQAVDPIQQKLDNFKITMSRNFAEQQHGAETVIGAIQALTELQQSNPGEYQRLEAQANQSMDPVGDVVKWHKRQRALSEIGEDPAAYRERVRQELLAEIQQPSTQQQPAAQQAPRLPSSFAAQRSAPPRSDDAGDGPRPASTMLRRR